jgi:hypothetical protein
MVKKEVSTTATGSFAAAKKNGLMAAAVEKEEDVLGRRKNEKLVALSCRTLDAVSNEVAVGWVSR